jgi:hypothetical protein
MDSINVMDDINNKIKKFYYDLIVNHLQNGWTDYIEQRLRNEWINEFNNYEYEYNYDSDYDYDYNNDYEYDKFYSDCWKDWLKIHYYHYLENPQSIYHSLVWEELINDIDTKIRLKLILYILLISFGFYVAK